MSEQSLERSRQLTDEAKAVMPGGVTSYARKFDRQINFEHGDGSKIYDVDGNEYIDYHNAWGAIVLGHCDPTVDGFVSTTLEDYDLFGYGATELEVEVAEMIQDRVPSAEKVLFGVTGSEVVARAITLARAVTGGQKIVKFQGTYHGWYDSVAMNHLSDENDLGSKDVFTDGLVPGAADNTIVLPFNDVEAVKETFREQGEDIAGVILEPIAHNMGCVTPKDGYLEALREITDEHDSLLIFDEIITGFRHNMGGAQKLEGVAPDLTTLGKSVANGYPLSVLCGKEQYMQQFHTAEGGNVAYGGTYNAQAASIAAARETIRELEQRDFHANARDARDRLCDALDDIIEDVGITAHTKKYGTVFLTYFTDPPVEDYRDVLRNDVEQYRTYRHSMIDQGVLMTPKNVRRNYIPEQLTDDDIERTIEAAKVALKAAAER